MTESRLKLKQIRQSLFFYKHKQRNWVRRETLLQGVLQSPAHPWNAI